MAGYDLAGVTPVPCWNCDAEMKRFAEDTFYHYYKCPVCGKEKMEPKEQDGTASTQL